MAYKDFDKFFNEMNKKSPITIKLYGETWDLPSDLPASTMLTVMNAKGRTLSEQEATRLAIDTVGKENFEEWCKRGMTMSQIEEIMRWVQQQHNGKQQGGKSKK